MCFAVRRFESSHLPVKINKSVALAKRARILMRLMIARQQPQLLAERLQRFAARIELLAKSRKIARRDVNIRGLRNDSLERANIAMSVAEYQNFHGRALPEVAAECARFPARLIAFV